MADVGLCLSHWSMSPNATVLVGSAATFTCRTDSSRVCWTYREYLSDLHIIDVCEKSYDNTFIDRCTVTSHNIAGTYTLTINDVRLSDAGFYSCGDCFDVEKATTHLLILGWKNLLRFSLPAVCNQIRGGSRRHGWGGLSGEGVRGAEGVRNGRGFSPSSRLGGLGERHKLPQRGPRRSPA